MGCYFCKQMKKQNKPKQYDILLIGLKNSGKTQIGYWIMKLKNNYNKFPSTVGVQTFKTIINNAIVTIIEVGGGDDIRSIWKHYFIKSMACIFVIDVSDSSRIPIACKNLSDVMQNRFMQHKPFVIMLTKLNEDSLDIVDFNDEFEELANRLQTPVLLSAVWNDDHTSIFDSLTWIKNQIDSEYDILMKRMCLDIKINEKIKNDVLLLKEGGYKKLLKTSKRKHRKRFKRHLLKNLSFRKKKIFLQINGNNRSISAPIPHRMNMSYSSDNLIINRTGRSLLFKAKSMDFKTSTKSLHHFKNKIQPYDIIPTQSKIELKPVTVNSHPIPMTIEKKVKTHKISLDKIDFITKQKIVTKGQSEDLENKNFQVTADVHYDASSIEITPVVSTATTQKFLNTEQNFQTKLDEYRRSHVKSAPPFVRYNKKNKLLTMEILLKSTIASHEVP